MRDILFRGKRKDNGEWVYWNIYGEFCTSKGRRKRLTRKTPYGEEYYYYTYELKQLIDPETVGQYTGLTDKNGKGIFEGDIIDTPDRLVVVTWLNANAQFDCDFLRYANGIKITNFKGIFPRDFDEYEVIGNIYDNKEILDVK